MSFQERLVDNLIDREENQHEKLVWRVVKKSSTSFTGGTGDAHGNNGGALDPYTLFTVTGDVVIKAIWGVCNTSLTGAATLEVGVAGNTAQLLAQIADTTTLDDGDIYTDAGTEAGSDIQAAAGLNFINDGADIIETTDTTDITAGQIDYYVIWAPAEANGNIVAA